MDAKFDELKVLLVDDNVHMRAIVATVLRSVGVHHVTEARDGGEALERLRKWPADVAFVDYLMSPIDGVEFTRLIRQSKDSVSPFLPIIMMTSHAEKKKVEEARDSGVTEFIVKPITAKAVIDRLNAVVFHPRPFVKTGDYVGPSRRRMPVVDDLTPRRRASDNKVAEI